MNFDLTPEPQAYQDAAPTSALERMPPFPAAPTLQCAMARRFATDSGFHTCNEALQPRGGYGYLGDHPIERFLRHVRVHQILEGTRGSCG